MTSDMAWASLAICLFIALHSPYDVLSLPSNRSTPNLKDIVLGRCWYYKRFKQQGSKRSANCTTLWNAFYDSFAFKDPCKLTFADYKPFFDAITGKDIVDKSLLWSGTYTAVHQYSDFDLRYTTLEDTLEGSMMNGLVWCGNPSLPRHTSDGIDYNSCPKCDHFIPFWGQASKKFAERVRGIVRVMVNGSRVTDEGMPSPAYNRTSFFGKYELPSFNVSTITRLEVLVVHTIDRKKLEKCGTGSIKLLQQDAKSRGLKVVCVDDPDDVKHILCADHSKSQLCSFLGSYGKQQDNSIWKTTTIALALTSLVLLIITVTIVISLCCRRVLCRRKADDTIVLTRPSVS